MTSWVFGIDGGGTSSRLRAESLQGEPLYGGQGGSTNPNSNDAAAVSATLRGLLAGAFSSGLDPAGCRAGFIGSAGVDRPGDRPRMVEALSGAFAAAAGGVAAPPCAAGNDAEPALVGALGDTEGFLLIAGTGSIAYGRARDGSSVRSGGWGHFLGDEGSAFWIAFEAIKRGIRSSEGRDLATGLLEAAVNHFKLADERAFIPFTYSTFSKASTASFAPVVAEHAERGDALGMAIMEGAVAELAALAGSVYLRFKDSVSHPRVALYGGLLDKNRWLRAEVSKRIRADYPGLEPVDAVGDAQAGACRLARELARG